ENLSAFLCSIIDRPLDRARRTGRSVARTAFEDRARMKEILWRISPMGLWETLINFIKSRKKSV
ncbi:MAG: hypothetical protein II112_05560, partial [Bacteroidales bacterium]|nr:hypothetical protein [Bacteroidales bacterium]